MRLPRSLKFSASSKIVYDKIMDLTSVFYLLALLFSVVIHEVAHGSVANTLGDPTAKYSGRLTLNPVAHLDPIGSIVVPLMLLFFTQGQGPIIGWAKPVPVNAANLRNPRWDSAKVAVAGVAMNFSLAVIFGMILRFVPLPPQLAFFFNLIVIVNLLLGVFNMVPVPPLDGSRLLMAVISDRFWKIKLLMESYGLIILVLFVFFGFPFIGPMMTLLYKLIVGSGVGG